MRIAFLLMAIVILSGCVQGTDLDVHRLAPSAGGELSEEQLFRVTPTRLAPALMGVGVSDENEWLDSCVAETEVTMSRQGSDTLDVRRTDLIKEEIEARLFALFPSKALFGPAQTGVEEFASFVGRVGAHETVVWLVAKTGPQIVFERVPAVRAGECTRYVSKLHTGAYLLLGLRVDFSGGARAEFVEKFDRHSPFDVDLSGGSRDGEMQQFLKDNGIKVRVAAVQVGGDPALVTALRQSGSRCHAGNLAGCRELVKSLREKFLASMPSEPRRPRDIREDGPWQVVAYELTNVE